jgi:DNA repair photolyase
LSLDINTDNEEIVKESQKWVEGNEGQKWDGKGIYSSPRVSSEIPDCSMPMTFDSYNYCSLGCLYCFAYFFKSNNPAIHGIELKAVNAQKMLAEMQGKGTTKNGRLWYKHFYSKRFLLHWGGLADPFCAFEKANGVGYELLKGLGEMAYPTLLSFKGSTIFDKKYVKLLQKYAHQKNFAFQCSIITNDDDLASKVEIGVPSTTRRLESLKMLSDMGYYTILRLRPFIIGISDKGLDQLLERALAAGVKGVSMEFFAMDGRANEGMKTRYDWLAKIIGVDDLWKWFKSTSPSERGGYMRSNRLVKEPYVRRVYEFCVKHGLTCGISDPDFKELNTSGSCCGMPDSYPDNPELTNWTSSQLTKRVADARRVYHQTGERPILKFNEVYGDEGYLDDPGLANDHVCVIGKDCATRVNLTQRIILAQQWNNLKSPANPRNYFHGKVMPCGLDEEDNLMFQYTPSEYEERWKQEGVDLTA